MDLFDLVSVVLLPVFFCFVFFNFLPLGCGCRGWGGVYIDVVLSVCAVSGPDTICTVDWAAFVKNQ